MGKGGEFSGSNPEFCNLNSKIQGGGLGGCVRGLALVAVGVTRRDVVVILPARLHGLVLVGRAFEQIPVALRPLLQRQVWVGRAEEVVAGDVALRVQGEEDRDAEGRGRRGCVQSSGGRGREDVYGFKRNGVRVQALDRLAPRAERDGADDVDVLLAEGESLVGETRSRQGSRVEGRLRGLVLRARGAVDIVAEEVGGRRVVYVGRGRLPAQDDGALRDLRGRVEYGRLADARGGLDQKEVRERGALPGGVDVAGCVAEAHRLCERKLVRVGERVARLRALLGGD